MDIRMPDMDGIAAAETLAQEKIAPVLLLTAFGDQQLVERAKGRRVWILSSSHFARVK